MRAVSRRTIREWPACADSDGYGEDASGTAIIHATSSTDITPRPEPTLLSTVRIRALCIFRFT